MFVFPNNSRNVPYGTTAILLLQSLTMCGYRANLLWDEIVTILLYEGFYL